MADAAHQNKPQVEILEPEIPAQESRENPNFSNIVEEKQAPTLSILEEEDKFSLINMLHIAPAFREKVLLLHKNRPELFSFDETKLKQLVGRSDMTPTLQRLRMTFWHEYIACRENHRTFKLTNIVAGICSLKHLSDIADNPHQLAFLICPPADYVLSLKEAHAAGLEKIREIFSARITDDEGYLNPKAADMVIKAYALIDARLKGAIVQRIDQRTISATTQLSKDQAGAAFGIPTDMNLLEQELEKTRKQLENYRKPKQITQKEVDEIVVEVKKLNDE